MASLDAHSWVDIFETETKFFESKLKNSKRFMLSKNKEDQLFCGGTRSRACPCAHSWMPGFYTLGVLVCAGACDFLFWVDAPR